MSKNIQNNQHYFKVSQENPETSLDNFYIFDNKNPNLKKYVKNTKEIKEILTTIKTLQKKKENPKIINKYFEELQKSLSEFSNCSEFICFVNACDNTLGAVRKDLDLIKKITRRYFSKRLLRDLVPEEWIQAIIDSNSSRKKGKCGELKLTLILKKLGFKEVKTWEEFNKSNKCVAQFSKVFSVKKVKENLKVKLKAKKQGKKLDLIIRYKNKIFLIEAKHLNTSGGGQDKQISELIEILNLKEKTPNISYISFLDGSYSNILISNSRAGDKLKTQRKEIKKYLKKNPKNYWLNTAGLKTLFSDLAKS
ncbi:MAG: hypothetical protein COY10_00280 [Candidatus Portnoybacteria bacterium CG_4_10_14_0_2_um_filter_43_36]|uniref:Restriction endonuclease type II DpnII-like domain-containing protein n=3 Tax=Candidatus Portnoyibacteriota TaxID=1817913 RepID=A0A2M7YMB7_9BACT|nr:MAG: hypothetical protein COX45_00615 [Candidatus Portnoybacteria bacterium CG23_combo_of_CG06-09_8_20_14_all_44_36]PIZ70080.1 MAG: hypothetical protein COY10_00280 [Candidatus Portnoybacteria bacterium CG_4_10_14_0_2_um_filter_43_36]PJA64118.1 MAG: hypothetical protein CO160_00265 [Candidatus Portnoybacteria bacterium CG_4_9_14_3_um_filter_43_11]PJE59385.1 MAG: hypothetical protein COU84_01050 [Candidatus Portnoybacteria bacterium CG10_big_fil_rev_8_21_14_0_10_43_39]